MERNLKKLTTSGSSKILQANFIVKGWKRHPSPQKQKIEGNPIAFT